MPQDKPVDSGTIEQWLKGVDNMRAMGSQFVAIYGAEPLMRMEGLAEVITRIYDVGMKCTLITAIPTHPNMEKLLNSCPLDSLTVSWDGIAPDKHREAKSKNGQIALVNHPQLRDRSCVATVSALNGYQIGDMAKQANDQGYYFLFDLAHDSGGMGLLSKCNDDGRLPAPTVDQVKKFTQDLLELKQAGGRVHASEQYLQFLHDNYKGVVRQTWHCRGPVAGWITTNSDGKIFPCDDYQVAYPNGKIWDTLDFEDLHRWRQKAVEPCVGCSWNTHWDAVAIEAGSIPIGSYVH